MHKLYNLITENPKPALGLTDPEGQRSLTSQSDIVALTS